MPGWCRPCRNGCGHRPISDSERAFQFLGHGLSQTNVNDSIVATWEPKVGAALRAAICLGSAGAALRDRCSSVRQPARGWNLVAARRSAPTLIGSHLFCRSLGESESQDVQGLRLQYHVPDINPQL